MSSYCYFEDFRETGALNIAKYLLEECPFHSCWSLQEVVVWSKWNSPSLVTVIRYMRVLSHIFGIQKSLLTAQQGKCRIPRMPSGSPMWPDQYTKFWRTTKVHCSKKCKCTYITLSKRHLDSRWIIFVWAGVHSLFLDFVAADLGLKDASQVECRLLMKRNWIFFRTVNYFKKTQKAHRLGRENLTWKVTSLTL